MYEFLGRARLEVGTAFWIRVRVIVGGMEDPHLGTLPDPQAAALKLFVLSGTGCFCVNRMTLMWI